MKVVKNKLLVGLFCFIAILNSNTLEATNFTCNEIESFISYKDAKAVESQGDIELSMQYYCNLAYLGDYRAQYKLSQYYYLGIEKVLDKNLIQALFWASLSNSVVISKKRSEFISKIKSELSLTDLSKVKELLTRANPHIISGLKYDMQYKNLDYNKINEELNKKKIFTGTRIKRKTPPGRINIIR